MDLKDCIDFANRNQTCWLATCDKDQPRVRGMMMWFADETGFYFHTGSLKNLPKQLDRNPKVEVCFYQHSDNPGEAFMMRVTGETQFLEDQELEKRLYKERPWMKQIKENAPEGAKVRIFRINKGEAFTWTLANNMRENEIPRIKFGE